MFLLNTIEGLLFRSYLSGYNLSLLHKCMATANQEIDTAEYRKASLSFSDQDFKQKLAAATEKTEQALAFFEKTGVSIIPYFDPRYPSPLLQTKHFPPLVFVKGNLSDIPCAAIVGSRQVSPLAQEKVNNLVRVFAANNYGILSGLAFGIDTLAHEAAINANAYTISVLPTSFDNLYPKENETLAQKILDRGGALITEQPPASAPFGNPFVLRDRIQAALSNYVVPVEMSKDSGTRHTLSYAMQYKKKIIFCLPSATEIDHYLPYYEGLILALKKYRAKQKENILVVKNIPAVQQLLQNPDTSGQASLFG